MHHHSHHHHHHHPHHHRHHHPHHCQHHRNQVSESKLFFFFHHSEFFDNIFNQEEADALEVLVIIVSLCYPVIISSYHTVIIKGCWIILAINSYHLTHALIIWLYHHIIQLSHQSYQLYHQERHGALLQIDFEAFIKNEGPVNLRLDPHHDSSLDYIEKVVPICYFHFCHCHILNVTVFFTVTEDCHCHYNCRPESWPWPVTMTLASITLLCNYDLACHCNPPVMKVQLVKNERMVCCLSSGKILIKQVFARQIFLSSELSYFIMSHDILIVTALFWSNPGSDKLLSTSRPTSLQDNT